MPGPSVPRCRPSSLWGRKHPALSKATVLWGVSPVRMLRGAFPSHCQRVVGWELDQDSLSPLSLGFTGPDQRCPPGMCTIQPSCGGRCAGRCWAEHRWSPGGCLSGSEQTAGPGPAERSEEQRPGGRRWRARQGLEVLATVCSETRLRTAAGTRPRGHRTLSSLK